MKKTLICIVICLSLFCCGRKEVKKVTPVKKKPAVKTVKVSSTAVRERVKYVYEGLSYRDPFIPLSGEKMAKAKLGLTKDAIVPNLGSLEIKGIIVDKKDRIALFTSPYGSYIFVNGKLYDSQNRLVKGITGKMIYKKGSRTPKGVVLITEDNYFKEYYLPEKFEF